MSNLATITNNILADSGIDDINVIVSTGSYANPSWITSLAWTKITGAPANIVTGTGTTNYLPKFTGASTIGNSLLTDNGTTLAYGNNIISVGASNTSEKYLEFGSSNGAFYVGGTSAEHYIFGQGDKPLRLYTNGTVKATLTSSGNLGLGVTPSAWSGSSGFDIGSWAAFGQNSANGFTLLTGNAFFNGTNYRYKNNAAAAAYLIDGPSGNHFWNIAPSGTAGNAITFTQAMTLTGGGNLLVGTTTDAGFKLDVNGTGRFSGSLTLTSGGTERYIQLLGYNNSFTSITSNVGFNSFYNNTAILNNVNSTASGQGNTSLPSWVINLGGNETEADTFAIKRSPAGSFTFSNRFILSSTGAAIFSSVVTATGNAATTPSFIANNASGTSGTAQHYIDFTAGATVLGRILRGNGASGLVANGLNIDNFDGCQIRLNQLGGSGGSFNVLGGNVGIGTASPNSPLHVVNSSNGFIQRFAGGTSSAITGGIFAEIGRNFASIGTTSNHGFNIFTNDLDRIAITSGGNVLIGTTTDNGARLQVNGPSTFNGTITGTSAVFNLTGGAIITRDNGTAQVEVNIRHSSTRNGVLSFTQEAVADRWAIGTRPSDGTLYFSSNFDLSTPRVVITSGGNVGIGTTSPTFKLDVQNNTQAIARILDTSTNASLILQAGTGSAMKVTGYNYTTSTAIPLYISVDGANTIMQSGGGNVLIGTTTTIGPAAGRVDVLYSGLVQYGMNIRTTFSDGIAISFVNSSGTQVGTIYQSSSSTAYNTSSDYRLKQDLKDFNGIDIISKIKTYDFEWKSDNSRSYGVIAHELKEVIDYAVFGEKDSVTMQGVDYSKLVPIMVKAIQELKQEINTLKQTNA